MGGIFFKQEIDKEIEKKLEEYVDEELQKEIEKTNLPDKEKNRLFKETKTKVLRKGRQEIIKIKKSPTVWCPNKDKTSCESSTMDKKPSGCFGDFSKEQCERSRLKQVKRQNSPKVTNLFSQRKNLRNRSLRLNEPMVWCPNDKKTSCVSSPMNKKPSGCFGDFSKEQCERSRLNKVREQNLSNVKNIFTQRRQQRKSGFRREAPMVWCPNDKKTSCVSSPMNNKPIGCFGDFSKEQCERSRLNKVRENVPFKREAPKAWCPTVQDGKTFCEYKQIDRTCNPPSYSRKQCLDKLSQ